MNTIPPSPSSPVSPHWYVSSPAKHNASAETIRAELLTQDERFSVDVWGWRGATLAEVQARADAIATIMNLAFPAQQ
jgi:hypothetical protein